jgi:predicted permease
MAALSRERPDQVEAEEWLQPSLGTDHFMSPTERQEVFSIVAAVAGLTMLVLIVACLNLSNLMLARAVARVRETSIRSALGANRWQAMRHLALEGAILSATGGTAGLLLGIAATSVLAALTDLPVPIDVTPDWRTTLACLGTVALAAATIGALPAWKVARRDLALAARDGGERASQGLQSTRLRSWLVAGQVAGCGVLLVFAGHMQGGLDRLLTRDVGFSFEQVAVMDASLAEYGLGAAAGRSYWSSVLEIVRAHPEVEQAALVDNAPLGPARNESHWASAPGLSISRHAVEPEFFSLMRIPILLGRTFRPGDDPAAVVVISETVGIRMYGQRDVIGREFPRDDGAVRRRIIGVARDAHLHEPNATNAGEQYTLLSPDEAGSALLLVRAKSDAARVLGPMRQASRSVAAEIAPATRLMRADFAQTILAPRVARSVAAAIAVLALFMAALGIAGLISYVARLRTKEMGIRMALGASTGAILRALLGRTGAVALIGAVLGLAGGWATGHVFAGDPFYLKPLDVLPYASATLTLCLSASAAALLPAIQVLRTDPLRALRVA